MREIKFRAQTVESGFVKTGSLDGQVWGTFYKSKNEYYMIDIITGSHIRIIPETIGQYTGKRDKNENESYEGDIVKATITSNQGAKFIGIGYIKYHNGKCAFQVSLKEGDKSLSCNDEIIGNVHENGDLIGKEQTNRIHPADEITQGKGK